MGEELTSKSEEQSLNELLDKVNKLGIEYERATKFIQKISLMFVGKGNVSIKEFLVLYKEYDAGR